MIRLLTAVVLFASFHAAADDCPGTGFSPPTKCGLHQLNNNEVADADKVMENFNTLGDAIDALPTPPTNCSTDQIIKWDDTNDVWVCANNPAPPSDCTTDQIIKWDGSAWVCADMASSNTAIAWKREWSRPDGVQAADEAFDAVERLGGRCVESGVYWPYDDYCQLWVMGVTDHTNCDVDMSASTDGNVEQLIVTKELDYIYFPNIAQLWSSAGTLHIAINCPTQ